ncbi:hypothetical protein AYO45_02745 [Gammaproteobacteria bacterium SCGC AG-212-F23]|nr:hypothetical protein AYO45_02745 [Gammaproteobacteria bacterium SCGC AG-212-F23]
MLKKTMIAHLLASSALLLTTSVFAQDSMPAALKAPVLTQNSMSDTQKTQIEQVVKNYLVNNPDVVVQSLQTYQQKQMELAEKSIQKTQETSTKYAADLFNQPNDPTVGNLKGSMAIVEFFDYQCMHCVQMLPVFQNLLKENSNLKIIYKEFPIRGPVSEFASRAALAANKQGKYTVFHDALMAASQSLTEDSILRIAKEVGLNVETLKTDMKSSAIDQQIKQTYKLAQSLGLMGTPAMFVGKSVAPVVIAFIPGQVDQGQLQGIIDKVSKQ